MPPDVNVYDGTLMAAAEHLAQRWHAADVVDSGGAPPAGVGEAEVTGWTVDQKLAFVTKLAQFAASQPLHKRTTRHIDQLYHFDAVRNPEVRVRAVLCNPAGLFYLASNK